MKTRWYSTLTTPRPYNPPRPLAAIFSSKASCCTSLLFAIVRLSVLTRPNPDKSRSRARGRSESAHECRRRIKIVKFLGLIAKRSVPDSSYSPLHTTDETGLQYHLPARLLACRGARTRHITLWRRGRSREARPHNLVSAMRAFAS